MNLTLVLTHQCNLACGYCYAGAKDTRRMDRETARAAIDAALATGETKLDLSFFGGEPLLEWDLLVEATRYAEERAAAAGVRLRTLVTTNGTHLTASRLAWLIEHRFFIGFSMDGGTTAQAGRPFLSGRSSFAAVETALDRLLASGYSRYEVLMVVDPGNAAVLADSVDYLVAKGVGRISFNPNFFTAWDEEARRGWERGYRRAAEHYAAAFRRNRPLYVNVLEAKIITAVKGGFGTEDQCRFEGREWAVAPSGNIYPCERLVGEDRDPTWVLGNVATGLSPERTCVASSSCGNVDEECLRCDFKDRCMNWCGCTNYLETGQGNKAGTNLCWHEKMAIPIADEVGRTLYAEADPAFMEKFYFEPRATPAAPEEQAAIAV